MAKRYKAEGVARLKHLLIIGISLMCIMQEVAGREEYGDCMSQHRYSTVVGRVSMVTVILIQRALL